MFIKLKKKSPHQLLYEKFKNYTMIPEEIFISNLKLCEKYAQSGSSIVECGVWRGGMIAGIAGILNDSSDYKYYLIDSFQGLPPVQKIDGEAANKWQEDKDSYGYYNNCYAEESFAKEAMKIVNIKNYELIIGWFKDTLPTFKPEMPISILRLDADWYESTIICLEYLYPHLIRGGVIIVDDYYVWDGCAIAIHDYLSKNKLSDRIYMTSEKVAYMVKEN